VCFVLVAVLGGPRDVDQYRLHELFLRFDLALSGVRSLAFRSVSSVWSVTSVNGRLHQIRREGSRALLQASGLSHKGQ
jgi:hypothetical protein